MEKEIVKINKNNLRDIGPELGPIMRYIIQWAYRFANKFHKPLGSICMLSWNSSKQITNYVNAWEISLAFK
jgi:hypothetical protein